MFVISLAMRPVIVGYSGSKNLLNEARRNRSSKDSIVLPPALNMKNSDENGLILPGPAAPVSNPERAKPDWRTSWCHASRNMARFFSDRCENTSRSIASTSSM